MKNKIYHKQTFILNKNYEDVQTEYIIIHDNKLYIKPRFEWDGCSGPTIDDNTNYYPCLIHDALYRLIKLGKLSIEERKKIDQEFYDMLIRFKVCKVRALYYYFAVRLFGGLSIKLDTNF